MGAIDLKHPLTVCRASAGTGKTYTLAAYYIGLLLSGESYRNILAVTFTNAATAEMKERILTYLLGIAEGRETEFLNVARQYMLRDADASDSVLRRRSEELLHAILQDYDNFSVSTIDAFLQQLIRGMAQAIDRTADFAISLDVDQVITRAVDMLLTTGLTDESKRSIEKYVASQMDEDKGWDIRANLIRIAKQFYREQVQMYSTQEEGSQLCLDEKKIASYRSQLIRKRAIERHPFEQAVMKWQRDIDNGATYHKRIEEAIKNMSRSLTETNDVKAADRFRGASATGLDKMKSIPELDALQQMCDRYRLTYWRTECALSFLSDMSLMQALSDCIAEALRRTNTALLADTAVTLAKALQPGDADFILEKAGVRYRHIMIDEFQDTSTLQWNVFMHLISDVLAVEGQTVLIVGDIKQSIYRFRNGNWQIMAGLGEKELQVPYNHASAPLVRNQRSRRNVVEFNLGVMKQIIKQGNVLDPETQEPIGERLYDEGYEPERIADYYREDKHAGGYVRCRFYPYMNKSKSGTTPEQMLKDAVQNAMYADVCATIENLLEQGERPDDILILAKINEQIGQWVSYCRSHETDYPRLAGTALVSKDSFKLDSCATVLTLVKALRYIHTRSRTCKEYVMLHCGANAIAQIDAIKQRMPLYEQLQRVFQVLYCAEGFYNGDDKAYINCFFDAVQTFIMSNGSDAKAFLQFWEDKLHELAISGDSTAEAIRLMTIHSSKGLEGKTVIVLNCEWATEKDHTDDILWSPTIEQAELPVIPVKQSSNLLQTGETPYKEAYEREHAAQRVDNYNLLYVALTRAADNLYVYVMPNRSEKPKGYTNMAVTLLEYTGLKDELDAADGTNTRYVEYTLGDAPYIHRPDGKKDSGRFSFIGAKDIPATLHSASDQVQFRQSQESVRYTEEGAAADAYSAQADFGMLCHDIFAHAEHEEDIIPTVALYRQQGLIENDTQLHRIKELLLRAFRHEKMAEWFDGTWQLKREAAIITQGALQRPDRVMIKDNKAVVLDYKFATPNEKHIEQVRNYIAALEKIGYKPVEGWLWYAFENKLERVQ